MEFLDDYPILAFFGQHLHEYPIRTLLLTGVCFVGRH